MRRGIRQDMTKFPVYAEIKTLVEEHFHVINDERFTVVTQSRVASC